MESGCIVWTVTGSGQPQADFQMISQGGMVLNLHGKGRQVEPNNAVKRQYISLCSRTFPPQEIFMNGMRSTLPLNYMLGILGTI